MHMPKHWLPGGKRAALCFSIDDIHPGRSSDGYEGGGDLGEGALGHVQWLIRRHPKLRVTLFTTADWREISPTPARPILDRIPGVARYSYRSQIRPKGEMAIDRHPAFVDYLREETGFEIALHGLHHIHPRRISPVEFVEQGREECRETLEEAIAIFRRAGLPFASGMTPPGWNASPALLDAMVDVGLTFVASARDILTPVQVGAKASMSGLKGVSLFEPERIHDGRLVSLPANFQATSPIERAFQIVEAGGLLSIKGHIVKDCCGHIALDGIDPLYCNYLDSLLTILEERYGDALWWTSMGEIAERVGVTERVGETGVAA
jgi:hypothetical protein